MNLEHRTHESVDIVKLPARLMMADSSEARSRLKRIIKQGSARLILDLSDMEFIDSSGLAALVNSMQTARKKNGDVCLMRMNETVRTLFELTQLLNVFEVFDDEATAIAALSH